MPRVSVPLTDFSRGEVSPTIEGRVDLDQYRRGGRRVLNATLLEEGGASRRPGMRYIAHAKHADKRARLVPFTAADGTDYVLEFGEGYIRFYTSGARVEVAGVPVEVATPYLAADLLRLKCVPIRDVLFIFSQFYQPRRLERYSSTVWKLRTFPTSPSHIPHVPPSYEYGERPVTTVAAGALTGSGVAFASGASQFLASDVGRDIIVFAGANAGARAFIKTVGAPNAITADITEAFTDTNAIAATDWRMSDSPLTTLTPSAAGPVGTVTLLTLGANGFRATDQAKYVLINGGLLIITSIIGATTANAMVLSVLSSTTAAQAGAWSLEEAAWSSFNGYPGAGADFQGRLWAGGTLAQPWHLWGSVSGDYDTFAIGVNADDAVAFGLTTSQIRWLLPSRALLVGGSDEEAIVDGGGTGGDSVITPTTVRERPETTYGSTDEVSPERAGSVALFASRSGKKLRELVYSYEQDSYVAPDLLLLARHLTRDSGIIQIAHQREPASTIWAVRGDGALLGCTYLRDQNVVGWHRHVTDGAVESVTVVPHYNGTKDQVWIAVRRIVGGSTVRTVEHLDDDGWYYRQLHLDSAITYNHTQAGATVTPGATSGVDVVFTASAPTFNAGHVGAEIRRVTLPGRALITAYTDTTHVRAEILSDFPSTAAIAAGAWALCPHTLTIPHLAGKTVKALADGAVVPDAVVSGAGVVTFAYTGVLLEVGIHYDSELIPMPVEVLQFGSTSSLKKRVGQFYIKFFETMGAEITGAGGLIEPQRIIFRRASDPLGVVAPLFTGGKRVRLRGISEEATCTIAQRQPLPWTVLFVELRLSVGA